VGFVELQHVGRLVIEPNNGVVGHGLPCVERKGKL
jgi:hypothetical protein